MRFCPKDTHGKDVNWLPASSFAPSGRERGNRPSAHQPRQLADSLEIVWRFQGFRLWLPDMIYQFAEFELDTGRFELRSNGVVRAVEPQVFALLSVLIQNRSRVVTRDELIEKVWNGRIVSESAVSSRVKSARQSIGDDGRAQTLIRTVHGIGFSFVGQVAAFPAVSIVGAGSSATEEPVRTSQPSIAVIPFDVVGATEPGFPIAEALPHDLITDLSRLRWLSVIARGSSFRFRGADVNLDEVRNKLGVQCSPSATVRQIGKIA